MPDTDNTPPIPRPEPGAFGPRAVLGHPTPVEGAFDALGSCATPLAIIGGASIFLFLSSGVFRGTAGARHSTRLQWQERQQHARAEIEARVEETEEAKKKSP